MTKPTEQQKANINQSIVLMGPCGVGKSLLSKTLAQKLNYPRIDIDDIIMFASMDANGTLSADPQVQQAFVRQQVDDLLYFHKNTVNREQQTQLVQESVDEYNYYDLLLDGFTRFRQDINDFYRLGCQYPSKAGNIYALNRVTYQILTKILATTDTPLVISLPGTFGWEIPETSSTALQHLQEKMRKLLRLTRNVLLQPGEDYALRCPTGQTNVNTLLVRYPERYEDNADLVVSTNGLFNHPENKFFKQRDPFSVAERATKDQLQNLGEINNICDQIMEYLGANFTKSPVAPTNTLSR